MTTETKLTKGQMNLVAAHTVALMIVVAVEIGLCWPLVIRQHYSPALLTAAFMDGFIFVTILTVAACDGSGLTTPNQRRLYKVVVALIFGVVIYRLATVG